MSNSYPPTGAANTTQCSFSGLALTKTELSYHCFKFEPRQYHKLCFQIQRLVYTKLLMFPHSLPLCKPRDFHQSKSKTVSTKMTKQEEPHGRMEQLCTASQLFSLTFHPPSHCIGTLQCILSYITVQSFQKYKLLLFLIAASSISWHSGWVLCSQ